jgi:hypothetical protein
VNETNCWAAIRRIASAGEQEQRAFVLRYAPAVAAYMEARWESNALEGQAEAAVTGAFGELWQRARAMQESDAAGLGDLRRHLLDLSRAVAQRVESRKSVPAVAERSQFVESYHRAWAHVVMRLAAVEQAERASSDPEARKRVELLRLHYFGGIALPTIARLWKTGEQEIGGSIAKAREEFEAALLHVVAYHAPGAARSAREECDELYSILRAAER